MKPNEKLARRAFIASLTLSAIGASAYARAQQAPRVYRIGVLGVASAATYARQVEALRRGLRDLGYVEGKNAALEFRWAEGNAARLPALAAELVRMNPDVLVTSGPATPVAKRATTTIPIVMAVSTNAVENGLVASLARPGGNITGSSSFAREISLKRLELLKEAFPRLQRIGLLVHSNNAATNPGLIRAMEDGARSVKTELRAVETSGAADFERAFAALAADRAEALVVADHTVLVAEAAHISRLANANRLPVIGFAEIADTGGLMAYGVDFPVLWHRAATFIDKILRGAKPGDLPVEQPMKFEFVVNLAAAKALGATIPNSVRMRADRVVE